LEIEFLRSVFRCFMEKNLIFPGKLKKGEVVARLFEIQRFFHKS